MEKKHTGLPMMYFEDCGFIVEISESLDKHYVVISYEENLVKHPCSNIIVAIYLIHLIVHEYKDKIKTIEDFFTVQ